MSVRDMLRLETATAGRGGTTQEAAVSRVTAASNSLTCWRRSEGNSLGTDPRTGGHRPKKPVCWKVSPLVYAVTF